MGTLFNRASSIWKNYQFLKKVNTGFAYYHTLYCFPSNFLLTIASLVMGNKKRHNMKVLSAGSHRLRAGMKSLVILAAIVLITMLGFVECVTALERALPFHPGEKLTFQVKWSFLPAGEAVLEILPIETIQGITSYHFVMIAKTYPFIDLFYKVRDRIDAFTDIEMTHSILYKKKKKGKSNKKVVVTFNWEKQTTQYSNQGKKAKPIVIKPGSFDPLSVFYAFRLYDLKVGTKLQIPVTDGKKCVEGEATVIKREKITVANRTYDTFLVEPDLKHIGGVFEKSKKAKLEIWVTADTQKIPVKMRSKVIVGSFVAELISAEGI